MENRIGYTKEKRQVFLEFENIGVETEGSYQCRGLQAVGICRRCGF